MWVSYLIILFWVYFCITLLTSCGPLHLWGWWDVCDMVKTWTFFYWILSCIRFFQGTYVCIVFFSLCSMFIFSARKMCMNFFGTSMLVGYFFKITSPSPLKSQMIYLLVLILICFFINFRETQGLLVLMDLLGPEGHRWVFKMLSLWGWTVLRPSIYTTVDFMTTNF